MSGKVEEVAVRLWRADSEDAGVPASIAKGRTLEAFRDQSDETRARWFKFARAAIEAMREPTKQMLSGVRPQEYTIEHYHGSGHHRSFPTLGSGPVQVWQDMIDAALREEGR